jgi:hypothetical protein
MTRWVAWSKRRSWRKVRDTKWHVAVDEHRMLCGFPIAPDGCTTGEPWFEEDDELPADEACVCVRCRRKLEAA